MKKLYCIWNRQLFILSMGLNKIEWLEDIIVIIGYYCSDNGFALYRSWNESY